MLDEKIQSEEITTSETEIKTELLKVIKSDKSSEEIKNILSDYHDNDIAEILENLTSQERKRLYVILGAERVSDIFSYLGDASDYLLELSSEKIATIVDNMDADDAVELLGDLSDDKKEEILELIGDESKEDIELINSYTDEQIGSKITTNFISINKNLSVKEAMKALVLEAADNDNISTVYAVSDNNSYYGATSLPSLFKAKKDIPFEEIVSTSYPYLYAKEEISACLDSLKNYGEDSIPVLDDNNQIIGVITASDVVEAVDEELSEDYAKFAALREQGDRRESLLSSLKKRTPWLIVLLLLGLLVSGVTGMFESVIDALPFIVCSQSLVLDMSGNVGTQSLAVTIRVLTDENISGLKKFKFILKEIRVAFVNALILSIISLAFMTIYLHIVRPNMLTGELFNTSLCISISLLVSMVLAGFIGTVSPILLHKCKVDPAVASGPLITALNDLLGVVIYYGLAYILLIGGGL